MSSPPDTGVVIVAAGKGERLGGEVPKQFREVGGVPVLLRAIRPFASHPAVHQLVVVLPAAAAEAPPSWLHGLAGGRLVITEGGPDRMTSVERGLAALRPELAVAVVHDGARPFVDPEVIDRVIAEARAGRGGVAAVPVSDTLKEAAAGADGGAVITRTVPRERLWRAQTPQAFPAAALREALARARAAGRTVTDEAAAVESLGLTVTLVPDRTSNLKITTADDLRLAEAIARGGG